MARWDVTPAPTAPSVAILTPMSTTEATGMRIVWSVTQRHPAGAYSPDADPDTQFLREKLRYAPSGSPLRLVDLFSGCGGITLGMKDAGNRLGIPVSVVVAVDNDPEAAAVYANNNPEALVASADVQALVPKLHGSIDILCGGPPCQGHSDLNNYTRRDDTKNALYYAMAELAQGTRPKVVLIENVPAVVHDRGKVVLRTRLSLEAQGYSVTEGVLDASNLGVPQTRRRHILLAARCDTGIVPDDIFNILTRKGIQRTVRWAIHDLVGVQDGGTDPIDVKSRQSAESLRRINYLFDNGVFDLPNSERPRCHQGSHSYKSVYGRLRWDRPAQTITTGFTSMGQGRYVHPSERRTITAHEAARLQTFPDSFDWSAVTRRSSLARLIGNAVPPLMIGAIGAQLLPRLGAS